MDKKNNYYLVYEKCCEEFAKYQPEEMAEKSGAFYDQEKKSFNLTYLNQQYLITYPEGRVLCQKTGEEALAVGDKIMLIHYLYQSSNTPLTGKWVPYRELKGSGSYYGAFVRYGINPLIEFFADKGQLFLQAGESLAGKPFSYGEQGLVFPVLPNIPLAIVLWEKDDELEGSANILFDFSATEQIHVEDLAALGDRKSVV